MNDGPRRPPVLLIVSALACGLACGCGGSLEPDAGPSNDGTVTTTSDAAQGDAGVLDGATFDAEPTDAEPTDATPDPTATIVPLFDENTLLEPALVEDTPAALITRFADRGRDRHAREDQFRAYEHYLAFYWEYRTVEVEVIDTIGKGGDTITFNVTTQWKLDDRQAELRFFYRGIGTVAEYHDNRPMTPLDRLHYTHEASFNPREGRVLQVGDKMEFELSQFLDGPPRGRDNYYGTTFLYIAGEGLVPWIGTGLRRDSEPIPVSARLGGATTVHANESNEPEFGFSQMATNTAPANGPRFMLGRRLVHTDFSNGRHDESAENPVWTEQVGKLGPRYVNVSCNACHPKNGRALPPGVGAPLSQFVVKVGDAEGMPSPALGEVLQPRGSGGEPEARLAEWIEQDGLRTPRYLFGDSTPERFSVRVSPQLVGLGLLEAIPEADIIALADPDDVDGDGISGRVRLTVDAESGAARLGRFGWKASQPTVRQQTAGALRTDMGVLTSVYPTPDCGADQTGCGSEGGELDDSDLDDLTVYVALLGVRPQRDFDDAGVQQGQVLFGEAGCEGCHVPRFTTSPFAPLAELRAQDIAPYTDLLLHDMGPGLADDLPEGNATGAEWRTPPLWGLGHTAGVSGGQAYLHDGRARTLEEAIRWHGGESEASKDAFLALSAEDQDLLLRFLRSL